MILAAAMLSSACVLLTIPPRMAFVHSSMDFNDGRPHEAPARQEAPEQLADRVETLAGESGLRVVSRDCRTGECRLVLEGKLTELSKTVVHRRPSPSAKSRTNTDTGKKSRHSEVDTAMAAADALVALAGGTEEEPRREVIRQRLQSRFFVRAWTQGETTRIELVGVPIQNGKMSCPALVAERIQKCRPYRYSVYNKKTPAEAMRHFWAEADISGRPEADVIERILKRLEAAR